MKTFGSYFWIISIALIASLPMPCYAQVETQRYFTPERTGWKINNPDIVNSFGITEMGFFEGSIYLCDNNACYECDYAGYRNWLISRYYGLWSQNIKFSWGLTATDGYVIPFLNFGKTRLCFHGPPGNDCHESTLTKDDNDFIPLP
jgi:hypothetical protein